MQAISFGKDNLPGYVVGDEGCPGVVVLQEWWGITDVSLGGRFCVYCHAPLLAQPLTRFALPRR